MEDMNIGKKLKALRHAKRLNQGEVAEATGIIRSSLSYFESGKRMPSVAQLQALASFYNVPLDYFGVVKKDDVLELLSRAKKVFESDIDNEKKKEVFDELMKLYISLKG
jgi:transcriptional regulator with XRE-family HTH domain